MAINDCTKKDTCAEFQMMKSGECYYRTYCFKAGTEATESATPLGQAELVGCEANGNVETKTPWWRTDRLGWPIETLRGKRLDNFIRIVLQNIRKITW